MKMKKLVILVAVLALATAACAADVEGEVDDIVATAPPALGAGDPISGADIYKGTCAACHARDLAGVDGVGTRLAPSDFVTSMSEQALAEFIAQGRTIDDPDSVMGLDMPPKGGNPSLSDQDLLDVSAYLQAQN